MSDLKLYVKWVNLIILNMLIYVDFNLYILILFCEDLNFFYINIEEREYNSK